MSMVNDMAFADQQANVRFLERTTESIDGVLSDGSMADGVALEACLGIIEHAKSFKDVLCSEDTDVILPARGPGIRGLVEATHVRGQNIRSPPLRGAQCGRWEQGGTREGPRQWCLLFQRRRVGDFDEALGLSLSVRVAVIRAAIVHFEEFISGPEHGGTTSSRTGSTVTTFFLFYAIIFVGSLKVFAPKSPSAPRWSGRSIVWGN